MIDWDWNAICGCVCAQSCPTLFNPMDCQSLPESSVHEIFQARIQEWGAISYSRASFRTRVLCLLNWQADSLPLSLQGNPEWYRDGFNFSQIISFIFQIHKLCPPKLWNTLSQFELKTERILVWVEWCRSTFHFFLISISSRFNLFFPIGYKVKIKHHT